MWTRLVLIFVFLLSVTGTQAASSIDLEVTRTPDSPGFVSVTVYAGEHLTPLPVEDIYVTNYTETEADKYYSVLDIATELGQRVVTPEEATNWQASSQHRLIWLGGDLVPEDQLHFQARSAKTALDDFEMFSEQSLGPVYFTNFRIKPNHNLNEIYPAKIRFLGSSGTFYAAYQRPVKTLVTLEGAGPNGEITATPSLYLDAPNFDSQAHTLGTRWETARDRAMGITPITTTHSSWWINAFPWILFILGMILIAFGLFHVFKEEFWLQDEFTTDTPSKPVPAIKIGKKWWDQPIEETPMYQDWEKNLPFEVVKKEDNS